MDAQQDDFLAELTFVRMPTSGGRFKKWNIKSMSFQDMLKKKRNPSLPSTMEMNFAVGEPLLRLKQESREILSTLIYAKENQFKPY